MRKLEINKSKHTDLQICIEFIIYGFILDSKNLLEFKVSNLFTIFTLHKNTKKPFFLLTEALISDL